MCTLLLYLCFAYGVLGAWSTGGHVRTAERGNVAPLTMFRSAPFTMFRPVSVSLHLMVVSPLKVHI